MSILSINPSYFKTRSIMDWTKYFLPSSDERATEKFLLNVQPLCTDHISENIYSILNNENYPIESPKVNGIPKSLSFLNCPKFPK